MHHAHKRKRVTKETLVLDEDYYTLTAREVVVGNHPNTYTQPISPRKGEKWTTKKTWEPEDRLDFALEANSASYDSTLLSYILEPDDEWEDANKELDGSGSARIRVKSKQTPVKAKRTLRSVRAFFALLRWPFCYLTAYLQRRPHQYWRTYSQGLFLDELIRHDGRGDFTSQVCYECWFRKSDNPGKPQFRCLDCTVLDLVCQRCCLRRHKDNHLHRVEVRTSSVLFTHYSRIVI
jgi:hypothetical protein